MNIKIKLLTIAFFIHQISFAQFYSRNSDSGLMLTNGIANFNEKFYFYGSLQGKVNVFDTTLLSDNTSSFVFISNNENFKIKVPFVKSTGYSEINEIYNIDSNVFLSGVFTNSLSSKKDSINVATKWGGFVFKIDFNDSIIWIKFLKNINNSSHLKATHKNDELYISYITSEEGNTKINVMCLKESSGDSLWLKSTAIDSNLLIENINIDYDTIKLFLSSKSHNYIYKINCPTHEIISQIGIDKLKSYIISNKFYKQKLNTLNVVKNGSKYNLILSSFDSLTTDISICNADYFASANIFSETDSTIFILTQFNGRLLVDTLEFAESDTSNCVLLEFYKGINKIVKITSLPLRNVFHSFTLDSNSYFISNYICGEENQSNEIYIGQKPKYNSDSKLIKLVNLLSQDLSFRKNISQSFSYIVYPNLSNGTQINIMLKEGSVNNIFDIELINSWGQNIPFKIIRNENTLSLVEIESLKSGIYYLKFSYNNSIITEKVIIVNN